MRSQRLLRREDLPIDIRSLNRGIGWFPVIPDFTRMWWYALKAVIYSRRLRQLTVRVFQRYRW
jgi:hypothetical protein